MTSIQNPYLDECRKLPRCDRLPWEGDDTFPLHNSWVDCRRPLVKRFAWAIPNDEAIAKIVEYSPIIEIGAGTGYWAKLVADAGGDIVAFDADPAGIDSKNRWHSDKHLYSPVWHGGPEKIAEHPGRTLFLCWPPYDDPFVKECLDQYRGDTLIYVGEVDACTGWDERLDTEWKAADEVTIPKFSCINDYLMVFKR